MTDTAAAFDWSAVAHSWDERRDHVATMKQPIVAALLTGLDLQAGEHVLELGAATGDFALQLATAVGPTGRVIASDVAPAMVALLETTAAAVDTIKVRRIDACAIDLPDSSVDAVVFRMGLMLVPDPGLAMREIRRVLKPGGRAAIAVWAGPAHNLWMSSVGMAAMMHGVVSGGPPTGPGGIFSLADSAVLQRTIAGAGFGDPVVSEVQIEASFSSADEHFDTVTALAGPLAVALRDAPEASRAAVRAAAAAVAEQHRGADGIVLPGRALVCVAVAA